jgi:hypothetical protein
MPNIFKKFLLSFLAFLVVLFSFAPFLQVKAEPTTTAPAEGSWYNQDFKTWMQKVNDQDSSQEIFGERYTSAQVQWVIYGLFNFLISTSLPPDVVSCVFNNTVDLSTCTTAIKKVLEGGVPTQSNLASKPQNSNLLGLIFNTNRSLSGINYVKTKINNFSLVPVAHAQGVGFTALTTVQPFWVIIRDISYGIFVLVAVIFAFMIMFRVKISPQTIITVQSAIPKIVISLILVTFSYAIAGFLIDLVYVVIGLLSVMLVPMIPETVLWISQPTYKAVDVFNLLTVGPTGALGNGGIFGLLMWYLTPLILLALIILIIGGIATILTAGAASPVIILGLIIFTLILILALWMALKTIWMLFKAFANILLLTIFAPIQITLGTVIPSLGFGSWVKSYISNLSVFVVTGVLWFFAWVFMLMAWAGAFPDGTITLSPASGGSNPWPPLLGSGGGGQGLLMLGVSFVLFTMIPKATEVVQAFLSGKPFAYGSGIGEAFGPLSTFWGYTGANMLKGAQQVAAERVTKERVDDFVEWVNKQFPRRQIVDRSK